MAPFFTDIDISKESGRIVYQIHNNFSNIFSSQVAQYINVAINTNRYTNFSAEWILIATWTEVSPYNTNNVVSCSYTFCIFYQKAYIIFATRKLHFLEYWPLITRDHLLSSYTIVKIEVQVFPIVLLLDL